MDFDNTLWLKWPGESHLCRVLPCPDAVLSLLDKPLSLLGKVNGILKPEDRKRGREGDVERDTCLGPECEGESGGGQEVDRCVRDGSLGVLQVLLTLTSWKNTRAIGAYMGGYKH